MSTDNTSEALMKAKLVGETAVAPWRELQRFYAAGQAVYVSESLDLVEVACQLSLDSTDYFKRCLDEGVIALVTDEQALDWYQHEVNLWAVVVRPWVLVQPMAPKP